MKKSFEQLAVGWLKENPENLEQFESITTWIMKFAKFLDSQEPQEKIEHIEHSEKYVFCEASGIIRDLVKKVDLLIDRENSK